jgi:hypothetical protein
MARLGRRKTPASLKVWVALAAGTAVVTAAVRAVPYVAPVISPPSASGPQRAKVAVPASDLDRAPVAKGTGTKKSATPVGGNTWTPGGEKTSTPVGRKSSGASGGVVGGGGAAGGAVGGGGAGAGGSGVGGAGVGGAGASETVSLKDVDWSSRASRDRYGSTSADSNRTGHGPGNTWP